ncbi:MAG TPA: hypothetical protein VN408_17760 [Actinoplanes sp.]|nr:hypothetical protein [Actinoplanes sp.]
MQRSRRIASIVVVASVVVAGLGACGFQPDLAARVGGAQTITEDRVQQIWDESHEAVLKTKPAEQASAEPVRVPYSRGDLVRAMVSRDLYGRLAATKGVPLPTGVAYDRAGAQLGLPGSDEYVHLYADTLLLQNALAAAVTNPPAPTEAEVRDVFDRIAANGGIQPGTDFAQFSSMLSAQDRTSLGAALAVRRDVLALADQVGIEINPRYQPFELTLLGVTNQSTGQAYSVVGAVLGEDMRVPVVDLS